jgi:hypothetical protein
MSQPLYPTGQPMEGVNKYMRLNESDDLEQIEFPEVVIHPLEVVKKMESASGIDWKKVSIRALSLFSGIALGVLTGMAVAGIMTTPVGWGIAGGALVILAIALIAAIKHGGVEELLHALKYAGIGFMIGFSAAYASAAAAIVVPPEVSTIDYVGWSIANAVIWTASLVITTINDSLKPKSSSKLE